MENPIKMDDLGGGGTPIFGNIHIGEYTTQLDGDYKNIVISQYKDPYKSISIMECLPYNHGKLIKISPINMVQWKMGPQMKRN